VEECKTPRVLMDSVILATSFSSQMFVVSTVVRFV
jgi:hypothetical protein